MAKELLKYPALYGDANLVAYYRFNSGALTTDSKNSFTLTNNNTVGEGTGKFGVGADFGNSKSIANKSLSIANNLGIAGGAITINLWVKINTAPSSGDTYRLVVQSSTNNVSNVLIYRNSGGILQLFFERLRDGVAGDSFTYNVDLGTSVWQMITLTYNGTTLIGYLNGNPVGSKAASGTGSGPTANLFRLGNTEYALTLMDDVSVFNRALTATEISDYYISKSSGSGFFNFF